MRGAVASRSGVVAAAWEPPNMHNLGFGAVNVQTQMVLVRIVTAAICGVLIYASFFHLTN